MYYVFLSQGINRCIEFALCALNWSFEVNVFAVGVLQVSGMRIYTPGDVEAVNGTDVRLKCTFQSSSPINPSAIIISWTFRPLKPGREESVSVCMSVCVCKIKPQTSLTLSGRIHPLSQLREESSESSGSLQSSQDSVCVCVYVCIFRIE